MAEAIDLVGERFGRLVVLERAEDHICKGGKDRKRRWKCICDCGNITYATTMDLRKGDTTSCGCRRQETLDEFTNRHKTHGMTNTRIYGIWKAMRARCTQPNYPQYHRYGGRGISICQEWLDDFMAFYEWAINNGYADDLSIDRIDVNGNYCPENCRWVTNDIQQNNKRTNKYYTYNGETHSIADWARILKLPYKQLCYRLYKGWGFEEAVAIVRNALNNSESEGIAS